MRNAIVIAVVLVLALTSSLASAQIPNVMLFFDQYHSQGSKDCPPGTPGTIADSAYVVALNFNMWLTGIEYSVQYPTEMTWIGDVTGDALIIGDTPSGIAQVWGLPQNAFEPLQVAKILFLWNCNGCASHDVGVVVAPHPYTGYLRATRYPDAAFFDAVGMTSLICATTPADESTWGKIKALYQK